MNILVTGGSGFIGRHLIQELYVCGHTVTSLDIDQDEANPFAIQITGSIFNRVDVRHASDQCDAIVHLAAVSSVQEAQNDPGLAHRTNVDGLRTVLEYMAPSVQHVVFASSAAVYGQHREERTGPGNHASGKGCAMLEVQPCKEDDALEPVSDYGRQKKSAELVLRTFPGSFNRTSLRLFNVYGEGSRGVIANTIQKLKRGEPPVCNGPMSRDFVHVSDVVRAIILALGQKRSMLTANVCTGVRTSIPGIMGRLIDIYRGRSMDVAPAMDDDEILHSVGSNERASKCLGWEPQVNLGDALNMLERQHLTEWGAEK